MITEKIDHMFVAEDITAALAAETTLEEKFAFCRSLEPEVRHSLYKIGPETESFVTRVVDLAKRNLDLIPRGIDVTAVDRNIATRDELRGHHDRMQQLVERMDHSVMLIGAQILQDVLAMYRSLKANGTTAGIEELLAEIGQRFARSKRREIEVQESPLGDTGMSAGSTTSPATNG
jgi:hypothetical protein